MTNYILPTWISIITEIMKWESIYVRSICSVSCYLLKTWFPFVFISCNRHYYLAWKHTVRHCCSAGGILARLCASSFALGNQGYAWKVLVYYIIQVGLFKFLINSEWEITQNLHLFFYIYKHITIVMKIHLINLIKSNVINLWTLIIVDSTL